MILVLFGKPGAGKTYVGNVLKEDFGFFFYEGDSDITLPMKKRLEEKKLFTSTMRKLLFNNLAQNISRLRRRYKKLVVSQTFIKEKYRKEFLQQFPNTLFVLIETDNKIREERLSKRRTLNDILFLRRMAKAFEEPKVKHAVLLNNRQGKESVKKQLRSLIDSLAE